jgi:hypothetical protein
MFYEVLTEKKAAYSRTGIVNDPELLEKMRARRDAAERSGALSQAKREARDLIESGRYKRQVKRAAKERKGSSRRDAAIGTGALAVGGTAAALAGKKAYDIHKGTATARKLFSESKKSIKGAFDKDNKTRKYMLDLQKRVADASGLTGAVRSRNLLAGGAAVGGLTAAYGGKKLYDAHKRKQQKKTAGLFREATPEDKLRQQDVRNRFKNVAFMGRSKTAQRTAEGYDNEIADLRKQYKKHRRGKMMSVMTGRLGQRVYHGTKAGGYKKRMDALMDERERAHGAYK